MNTNSVRRSAVPAPSVTVCRGCCCGTDKKHPDLDHTFQIQQLRAAVGDSGRVRVVDECLGVCERSNVMVVLPSSPGRACGGRPTWLGFVMDDATIFHIADWMAAGGPGIASIPMDLAPSMFSPPEAGATPSRSSGKKERRKSRR